MQPPNPTQLPYATSKSLRILGKIRVLDADFQVDEEPAYPPSGDGEHLFVHFEKTGLDTPVAVRNIARALECNPREASYAGLKDRHAVTSQWASFAGAQPEAALALELPGIRVLSASPHGHKLKTGHLRSNRFRIRIREPEGDVEQTRALLARLVEIGVPNYYGEQRFGTGQQNLTRARAWLVDGGRAPRDRFERKLLMSTWQSDLFNRWLSARVLAGELTRAVDGDLMRKEDSGGLFTTDDLVDAQARMDSWEISPTGPMFGIKMRWPQAEAEARERALFAESGITEDTLRAVKKCGEGARRPARIRPLDVEVGEEEGDLWVNFTLPKGAYATVVLRELMKPA